MQNDLLKKPDTLDLREFGRTLLRRRRMIMLITAIIMLLALLITLLSKPVYRATATLQIERESSKVVNIDSILGSDDIRDTRDFYQTQFELIRSRALASQVIDTLKLEEQLSSTSIIGQIKTWFNTPNVSNQRTALEDLLLDNLTVEPVKNSRLVAINYTSPDPVQAAKIANTVVSTFKDISAKRRSTNTESASQHLQKTVDELKALMDTSEQSLQKHMREHQISEEDGVVSTPTLQKLQEQNNEFISTQNQRMTQERQYAIFADDQRQWNQRIEVLEQDAWVSALKTQLQRIEKSKEQYEKQSLVEPNKQIAELEKTIQTEISDKLSTLSKALDEIKRKESDLSKEINTTKQAQDDIINTYRTLQQEFFGHQELYKPLKKRLGELSLAGNIVTDNIAIIDPAQIPLKKFKPNLSTNLLFGGLLGLLLGISAAFMREFLDDTVKDINALERATQLPVLGVMAETSDANSRQLATATISKPRSAIAEAFRSLRTSLRFMHQGDDTPVIFITSASPNEGKTTTASNLACAYASAGNRVLLVDADLRNPSLHKTLGIHAQHGLANYLAGALDSRELIQTTDIPNLYLLTAGSLPDDPAELLSSPHMRALLASAKQNFDQIILDGPPVLGLADALILASQASATLLTVRAEHTRMVMLENALIRLRRAQAPLAGILLNRVDLHSGYGDDYGGYVYQAEEQRAKPTAMSKWLAALKKL